MISVKFYLDVNRRPLANLTNGVEKITENFNRLSRVYERYRQTDDNI